MIRSVSVTQDGQNKDQSVYLTAKIMLLPMLLETACAIKDTIYKELYAKNSLSALQIPSGIKLLLLVSAIMQITILSMDNANHAQQMKDGMARNAFARLAFSELMEFVGSVTQDLPIMEKIVSVIWAILEIEINAPDAIRAAQNAQVLAPTSAPNVLTFH